MNRPEAEHLARTLMAEHGLDAQGWTFGWSRSVTRFGQAEWRGDDARRLVLSGPLTDRNGIEQVRDTILHEIAHALVGREGGHGPAWRAKAAELGARPERLGVGVGIPPRWAGVCPSCDTVVARRHRLTRPARRLVCAACWRRRGHATPRLRWVEQSAQQAGG